MQLSLGKPARVDCLEAALEAVDAQDIGAQPDDGTKFAVQFMRRSTLDPGVLDAIVVERQDSSVPSSGRDSGKR